MATSLEDLLAKEGFKRTYQFAMYYKDWIMDGAEAPSVPLLITQGKLNGCRKLKWNLVLYKEFL
ncbi:hypothetical protein ACS0TY_010326 [Phlomoides rotata]